MFRPKPQNHHLSDTTKNCDLMTKMQNAAKKRKITKKAISANESDSEDSDYEYDIPLMHIKDGLKGWCDSSPIGQRTRSRVCQNKVLRCKNGKEEWDLDDYERWESKQHKEVKIVSQFWPRNITTIRDKDLGLLWTSCVQEPEDTDSEEESLPINYNHIVPLINRYTH